MSHTQVRDKLSRVDHDPGYPCKSTITVRREIQIGAYGTFAEVSVKFDADATKAINDRRCKELAEQMVDLASIINDAASASK